jgi:hypothetical protein
MNLKGFGVAPSTPGGALVADLCYEIAGKLPFLALVSMPEMELLSVIIPLN